MFTLTFLEGMEAGLGRSLFTWSLWRLVRYLCRDWSKSDEWPMNFRLVTWLPGSGFVKYVGGL